MRVAKSSGLRRVLDLVGPSIREANAAGGFNPSSYATPLAVGACALEAPFVIAVTATTSEAEQLRDALSALLGDDDAVGQRTQNNQPLCPCARLPKYEQQHADSEQTLCGGEDSSGNLAGEGQPVQMRHQKKRREHPREWFPAAAAGAQ